MNNEDFLTVDNPLPGQNYCCLSFVSPEKIIKKKDAYYIHGFLKAKSELYNLDINTLEEEYETYIYNNKDEIEKKYYEENDFQTTIRGVKVRGVYDTKKEASIRAEVLRRKDKGLHHIFVGQVGYWLPWDPNADDIEDQQYTENQLNKLVKKYNENKKKRDVFFEQQKEDNIEQINKENSKNKENNDDQYENDKEQEAVDISNELLKEDPWLQRKINDGDIIDLDNE